MPGLEPLTLSPPLGERFLPRNTLPTSLPAYEPPSTSRRGLSETEWEAQLQYLDGLGVHETLGSTETAKIVLSSEEIALSLRWSQIAILHLPA